MTQPKRQRPLGTHCVVCGQHSLTEWQFTPQGTVNLHQKCRSKFYKTVSELGREDWTLDEVLVLLALTR